MNFFYSFHVINSSQYKQYFTMDIFMRSERWVLSCNAKNVGTLYFIFALFSGLEASVRTLVELNKYLANIHCKAVKAVPPKGDLVVANPKV